MIPRKVGGKIGSFPGMGGGKEVQFEIAIGEYGFITEDEIRKAIRKERKRKMTEMVGGKKEVEEIDEDRVYCEER